jgi:putative oxidoreductase
MRMRARSKEIIDNRWLIFSLRVALGGIFIAASVSKLSYQAEFINTVIGYGILPDSLARSYALVVPWAELFIGCALVLGIFTRLVAALSIPLILSFIVANVYGLFHPVADICGCFGPVISLSHPASLAIDAVMLLMAVELLLHKYEVGFLSIGPLLSRLNLGLGRRRLIIETGSKFAIVALAGLVIGMPLIGAAQGSTDSSKPALLAFYEGCRCQVNAITGLEPEYKDRINFIYIDRLNDPQTAEEFNVTECPSVLLMSGKDDQGKYIEYKRFNGTIDQAMLNNIRASLNEMLSNGST